MMKEGPDGFKGGMTAKKYIAITGHHQSDCHARPARTGQHQDIHTERRRT